MNIKVTDKISSASPFSYLNDFDAQLKANFSFLKKSGAALQGSLTSEAESSSKTPNDPSGLYMDESVRSPNFKKRTGPIRMLVIHRMRLDETSAKTILTSKSSKVSANYLASGQSGNISRLVKDENAAFHAGKSKWKGLGGKEINNVALGYEVALRTGEKMTPKAFNNIVTHIKSLMAQYNLGPDDIVYHSDIAFLRRANDPGADFPVRELAEHGIGVSVKTKPSNFTIPVFKPGDAAPELMDFQKALARFGYDIKTNGVFYPGMAAIVGVVQKRFLGIDSDGRVIDAATLDVGHQLGAYASSNEASAANSTNVFKGIN